MFLLVTALLLFAGSFLYTPGQAVGAAKPGNQDALGSGIDPEKYKQACPDYLHYSVVAQYVRGINSAQRLLMTLISPPAGL